MNKPTPRKLNNWRSELYYSTPKSFQVGVPRASLPKPNSTPFKQAKELNQC